MKHTKPLHGSGTGALTPATADDFDNLLPDYKKAAVNALLRSKERQIVTQSKIIHTLTAENAGLSAALAFLKGYLPPPPITAEPTPGQLRKKKENKQ